MCTVARSATARRARAMDGPSESHRFYAKASIRGSFCLWRKRWVDELTEFDTSAGLPMCTVAGSATARRARAMDGPSESHRFYAKAPAWGLLPVWRK